MKNVTLLHSKLRRGFSLFELLMVIMVLGIMVAIAIPHFSSITGTAQDAVAKRNAQTIVSSMNTAFAAGAAVPAGWNGATTGAAIVDQAETGISPTAGIYAGKVFSVGDIDDVTESAVASHLSFDATNKMIRYTP
jgi:prepilin-type N-terminal cleavage/methylation domain-containing protein